MKKKKRQGDYQEKKKKKGTGNKPDSITLLKRFFNK